jgi:hypothetical protein
MKLKGIRFDDILKIQQKSKEAPQKIIKQGLKKYFQQWQNHWTRCISSQGYYFKANTMKQPVTLNSCLETF